MTLHRLREMHASGEKIAMLTCYDAAFARVLDAAGVDSLLVGDSLGMVLQGHSSTVPVTMDEMIYHTACVARAQPHRLDHCRHAVRQLPGIGRLGVRNAVRLMQAGAQMVKLEGGGWTAPIVRLLVERGIPVCAHLGFTPQSVHALGGYRVQGRDAASASTLRAQAQELVGAGAQFLLLEMVPAALARELTKESPVPVIGIGAGTACSGQVLVLHDMLGLTPETPPRFVRNFMAGGATIQSAVGQYVKDVREGRFPDDALHSF
jgi:3-methyl-2-oxobutanoate hydroxymethyltransferase